MTSFHGFHSAVASEKVNSDSRSPRFSRRELDKFIHRASRSVENFISNIPVRSSVTSVMGNPGPNSGRSQRAKRVARACDPCRRKRLKCTPGQRPCLNCQIYNAECTSHDQGRRPYQRPARDAPSPDRSMRSGNPVFTPPAEDTNTRLLLASDIEPDGSYSINGTATHNNSSALTPWSQEQELSSVLPPAPDDFDSVLRQLDIGFSSSFREMDRIISGNLPGLTIPDSAGLGDELRMAPQLPTTNAGQMLGHSQGFLPSSRQKDNLDRGRVSNIWSLTGAVGKNSRLQTSVPGMFVRKNEVDANYLGFNSIGASLAICLKDALEFQKLPLTASSLHFLIEAGPHVDEVGLSSTVDLSLFQIPPQEIATQAVEAFFQTLNILYPIIDKETYQERYQAFYSTSLPNLNALDYSLFFLILSIGGLSAKSSTEQPEAMEQLSVNAYRQAWTIVQDSIASPTEISLQILLLHVVYHFYHGKAGIAWVFCGLATRVAQSLGLHRRSPVEMEMTNSQHNLRSRLWWIVFSLDATLSLSQGRPPGIADATYEDSPVLTNQNRDDTDDEFPPGLPEIYTWMHSLSQIQNRFCNAMHVNSNSTARLDALLRIKKELITWRDSIPLESRPGDLIQVPPQRYANVMLLHLEYFNLSRVVHWTIISLRPTFSGTSDVFDQQIRASEALCVEAARSFIKTLTDGMGDMKGNKLFVASFQTINYMAAIAVLYRSISKSPFSLSARADLEHLRAGKIHLERDTPAGLARPELKKLFDDMLISAHDLVCKQTVIFAGGDQAAFSHQQLYDRHWVGH